LLRELGPSGDRDGALAAGASMHLRAGANRAVERGDDAAAGDLFRRAARLTPDDRRRALDLMDAGVSLVAVADYTGAAEILGEAADAARGDHVVLARIRIEQTFVQVVVDASGGDVVAEAERSIPLFEAAHDDAALARAWSFLALRGSITGDFTGVESAADHALLHARRTDDRRLELQAIRNVVGEAIGWGPRSVSEDLARLERMRGELADDRLATAYFDNKRALLHAMSGEIDAARERWGRALGSVLELGDVNAIGYVSQEGAVIELLADDPAAAEAIARRSFDLLSSVGSSVASVAADQLAEALYRQGRFDEAEEMTRFSEDFGMAADDPFSAPWMLVRGKILARRGAFDDAETLARNGVALLSPTGFLIDRASSLVDLAEVLGRSGKREEAERSLQDALALFEEKGNVVSAAKVRELLAAAAG
jgi:tetratricopeptide (TPR) repeat protein